MGNKRFSVATNKRLQQYIGLSYQLAKQRSSGVLTIQERQQAALIGIARGLESYQSDKSSELSWVYFKGQYAIEDAIRQEVRKRKRTQKTRWEQMFELQSREVTSVDNDYSDCNSIRTKRLELLRTAIKTLDSRTAKIVKRIAFKHEKQKKVAESLNISQSWCSRLFNRGLEQIREYILANE